MMYKKITLFAVIFLAATLWFFNNGHDIISEMTEKECSDDRFCSFEELDDEYEEGSDYEVINRTEGDEQWLFSAIHGGGIEETTSTLAEAASGSSYPFYAFKGKLSSNNFSNLHITSTHFDEPRALDMVSKADHHIAVHGAAGTESKTMIGGLDEKLKEIVRRHLEEKGFVVTGTPDHLNGEHPDNYTNKTKTEQGVQLEITRGQRKEFFKNGDISFSSRNDPSNETQAFKDYVEALREAVKTYESSNE
ncbi:poly-gamma-glutamate hydrolase family protein [Halobacillus sp. B23F22_1]|uniref:poly-gamma-glutamate hydrolase family protein n=1 Tax=Halobacillus sp. B23F22_1 TaxID=3459514 RepID=UPI00373EC4EE